MRSAVIMIVLAAAGFLSGAEPTAQVDVVAAAGLRPAPPLPESGLPWSTGVRWALLFGGGLLGMTGVAAVAAGRRRLARSRAFPVSPPAAAVLQELAAAGALEDRREAVVRMGRIVRTFLGRLLERPAEGLTGEELEVALVQWSGSTRDLLQAVRCLHRMCEDAGCAGVLPSEEDLEAAAGLARKAIARAPAPARGHCPQQRDPPGDRGGAG